MNLINNFTEEEIKGIFQETHNRLLKLESIEMCTYDNGLVLPINQKKDDRKNKSKKESRYSEQETKQIAIEIAKEQKFLYSVETPTKNNYYFGEKIIDIKLGDNTNPGISARTDLSLYKKNNPENEYTHLRIEFKSGVVEPKNIAKDMLKLIAEDQEGVYFHSLLSANNGTLYKKGNQKGNQEGLISKIENYSKLIKESDIKVIDSNIHLFISCIEPKFLIYLKLNKRDILDANKNIEDLIMIDYTIKAGEFKINKSNWSILN